MSYQKDRDNFIVRMAQEGASVEVSRNILRNASTLHRFAIALCNGAWPCDNGQRKVVECVCGNYVDPSDIKCEKCTECRAQVSITKLLPEGFKANFQGDPRGAVVKIVLPSGYSDSMGRDGFCVPTK